MFYIVFFFVLIVPTIVLFIYVRFFNNESLQKEKSPKATNETPHLGETISAVKVKKNNSYLNDNVIAPFTGTTINPPQYHNPHTFINPKPTTTQPIPKRNPPITIESGRTAKVSTRQTKESFDVDKIKKVMYHSLSHKKV